MHIAVLSFDNPDHACAHYRVHSPLSNDDVTVSWAVSSEGESHAIDGQALQRADIILVQRFFPVPFTEPVLEACFASGKPVIYDTDDNFQALAPDSLHGKTAGLTIETLNKLGNRFTCMTASTPLLARALQRWNPTTSLVPNRLDGALWPGRHPSSKNTIRILYAGTLTHGADLEYVESILTDVLDAHNGKVSLTLFGCSTSVLEQRDDVRILQPMDSYSAYAARMNTMRFDIALAPLTDTEFNRAKSHVKWLEYSACGMAGIYSDLPPYSCIEQGVTGLKAASEADWRKGLATLINDAQLRTNIALESWKRIRTAHLAKDNSELLALCYRLLDR